MSRDCTCRGGRACAQQACGRGGGTAAHCPFPCWVPCGGGGAAAEGGWPTQLPGAAEPHPTWLGWAYPYPRLR